MEGGGATARELDLEASGQGGSEAIGGEGRGVTTLKAGRLGAPFPGSLERLAGPAQPVQSSSDAGRTGRGRTGVED